MCIRDSSHGEGRGHRVESAGVAQPVRDRCAGQVAVDTRALRIDGSVHEGSDGPVSTSPAPDASAAGVGGVSAAAMSSVMRLSWLTSLAPGSYSTTVMLASG